MTKEKVYTKHIITPRYSYLRSCNANKYIKNIKWLMIIKYIKWLGSFPIDRDLSKQR